MSRFEDVKNGLVGTLIGVLSMLPGASGGVAAVVFGVYERMIDDLADIFRKWRTDFRFLFFLGGGMVVGMAVTAFGLDWLMSNLEVPAMFFFTGLIAGQFPDVYRMTQEDGEKAKPLNYTALIVGILITVALMFAGNSGESTSEGGIAHTPVMFATMILVGVIIAASKIAPGISGSAILLAMGLYKQMLSSFTSFDFAVIITFGIGLVIGILLFAKIVSWALKTYRKSTYYLIFGLTIGSTAIVAYITVFAIDSYLEAASGIVAVVLGLAASLWLSKISKKYSEKEDNL